MRFENSKKVHNDEIQPMHNLKNAFKKFVNKITILGGINMLYEVNFEFEISVINKKFKKDGSNNELPSRSESSICL